MAAAVKVQRLLGGLPAGVPDRSVRHADVYMEAVGIQRAAVVAVAGNAPQAGVLIEAVASRRIGYQGEEVFAAQIVDPGQRRRRGMDYILPERIIKMTVLHRNPPYIFSTYSFSENV